MLKNLPAPSAGDGQDTTALLDTQAELIQAMASLTVEQARLIQLLAAGTPPFAAVAQAGYKTKHPGDKIASFKKHPRFAKAYKLAMRATALQFGLPAAWKREQLVLIVLKHRDHLPQAAISALRLLAELDGDLKAPLVNVNVDDRILIVTPDSLRQMADEAIKTIEHKE